GAPFRVAALAVTGAIEPDPGNIDSGTNRPRSENDFYSLTARQGDLFNFQVFSGSLTRTVNPIDSVLRLFIASGTLLATNDDDFESRDSSLVDWVAPADGLYYVEVDTFTPDGITDFDIGTYELFVYRFSTGASLGLGDTLIGGSGDETLMGVSGNDL